MAMGSADASPNARTLDLLCGELAKARLQAARKFKNQENQTHRRADDGCITRVLGRPNFPRQVRCQFGGFGKGDDAVAARLPDRRVDFQNWHAQCTLVLIIVAIEPESRYHVSFKGMVARIRRAKVLAD